MRGSERPTTLRRAVLAGTALLAVLLGTHPLALAAVPKPTRPSTSQPVTAVGCEEHEAWVDGDARAVAAVLPKPYTPLVDPSGHPVVFARAEHCAALNVGGRVRPATIADWGVVVNSPDGLGCASGLPVLGTTNGNLPPICNWYPLSLVSDDASLVAWLHAGTPSLPVRYTPDLVYQEGAPDPLGQTAFHFAAPRPAPEAFSIDDVSSVHPGELSLRGGYWFAVPGGTVKLLVSTDDLTTGRADTVLRAAGGSPLAHLMGATSRSSAAPYEEFGVIRIGHGVLRKELFTAPRAGERVERFAGSCSAQGNVTFNPPATNATAWTTYTYDATGTCTGRLDDRPVSGVPMHIHHSGRSDASCLHGLAFPPGTGTVTFPGLAPLAYTLDFTTELTEVYGTVYGTRSGQATAHATFLTQRTSPSITAECATSGVRQAPMDTAFTTQQDLTSDITGSR